MFTSQRRAASRRLGLAALVIWSVWTAAGGASWISWPEFSQSAPVDCRIALQDRDPATRSFDSGVRMEFAAVAHEVESIEPEDDFERHFARIGALEGQLSRRLGHDTGRHHGDRHAADPFLARGPPRV